MRKEIESALRAGASLSGFVETAALEAARRRKAQEEFLARGRASPARAKRTGELYDAGQALVAMHKRLEALMRAQHKDQGTAGGKG